MRHLLPSAASNALWGLGCRFSCVVVEPSAHYWGAFHPGQQPHLQQPGGGCRCYCLLVGGVDQVDSVLPKLWRRGDIPGAPLSATEVSLLKDQRQPDDFSPGLAFGIYRLLFPLAFTGHGATKRSLATMFWGAREGASERKFWLFLELCH